MNLSAFDKIDDEYQYSLSEIHSIFNITQADVLRMASSSSRSFKVCTPVTRSDCSMYVVDVNYIKAKKNRSDQPFERYLSDKNRPTPHVGHDKVFACIVDPIDCAEIYRSGKISLRYFAEAYSRQRSQLTINEVKIIKPAKNREHSFVADYYEHYIRFCFYEKKGYGEEVKYETPISFETGRESLFVLGEELKRLVTTIGWGYKTSLKNKKLNKKEIIQVKLHEMMNEIIERAKEKNCIHELHGEGDEIVAWPGNSNNICVFSKVWFKHKNYRYLSNSRKATIMDYRAGVIRLNNKPASSDFYVRLFPEFKEEIENEMKHFDYSGGPKIK